MPVDYSTPMTDAPPRLRYFTPAEANELLPELAVSMSRCAELMRRCKELRQQARPDITDDPSHRAELEHQAETCRAEAEDIVQDIAAQGVEVKGIDPALLDFPALRNGREVFLCWRQGESHIEAWHPVHTGYAGRQPLDFQDLGAWEWCN